MTCIEDNYTQIDLTKDKDIQIQIDLRADVLKIIDIDRLKSKCTTDNRYREI